jgi:uncharacterized protein HemX
MKILKNLLLVSLCLTITSDIHASWYGSMKRFVLYSVPQWFLTIKRPTLRTTGIVVGGVGLLAIAGTVWWKARVYQLERRNKILEQRNTKLENEVQEQGLEIRLLNRLQHKEQEVNAAQTELADLQKQVEKEKQRIYFEKELEKLKEWYLDYESNRDPQTRSGILKAIEELRENEFLNEYLKVELDEIKSELTK